MRTINVKISDFSTLVLDPKKNERIKIICKGSVESFKALKEQSYIKIF